MSAYSRTVVGKEHILINRIRFTDSCKFDLKEEANRAKVDIHMEYGEDMGYVLVFTSDNRKSCGNKHLRHKRGSS
ncbi:Hypothetical predicted protein [Octopus vulgaris]|uniref:Uncharacterized protein n=1 Tax=Octopus vulgaris TaxID=6645 RepID=A0AA36FAP6_OCTVU|nr:Hypothetical predicted protein [Octopus vulgaris]